MTRVLIVDDDPLVRAALSTILLSADDLELVGEAADGAEALKLVQSMRPDVVVMDLRMEVMDGRTATAAIMKLPNPPHVLILTTFEADEQVLGALDVGASGFLLKDTPPLELIDAVRNAVLGRAVLSPTHTKTLLNRYTEIGSGSRRGDARQSLSGLSDREMEIVRHVVQGLSNAEIAEEAHCAPATVKAHLAHIFTRLNINNRVRLAIIGHDAGLSDPDQPRPL